MKITFIGAGNMGGAVARGLLGAGVCPDDLHIIDLSSTVQQHFWELGVRSVTEVKGDVVVVAVKPWQSGELAELLSGFEGVVCSLMAGITIAELGELYSTQRVVRVMPNTAVEWGEGVSFVVGDGSVSGAANGGSSDAELIESIFRKVGVVTQIPEDKMDAYMVMGSCGLAYALRYAHAAMQGGTQLGVGSAQGQAIMAGVLRGAATLLEKGEHPESLIDKITTPGGITIRGLNAMEGTGFTASVLSGYTIFDKKK